MGSKRVIKFIKSYYVVTAILFFILFLSLAYILAPSDYNFLKDAISALGAQGYHRKIIMQLGFLAFGAILSTGIINNSVRWSTLPVLIYALSMAMLGIFCSFPIREQASINYSHMQAGIHSFLSQIAAISFWAGILFQLISSEDPRLKIIHFFFLVVPAVIGISFRFMLFKNVSGLMQRILFLISFVWLLKFYNRDKTPRRL